MSLYSKLRTTARSLFTKHLFATNAVLGTGFMCAGDALLQSYEIKTKKQARFDMARTKNMFIVGASFGVCGHKWYSFLDRKFPGHSLRMVGKKLLCEAAICPPLAFILFIGVGMLNSKPFRQSLVEFKHNILLFCMADWGCFVPAQAVNFFFLPPRFRFLYVSAITMVYDIFLSFILHRDSKGLQKLTE
ncbi:mpv17-like protein 2 [Ixodes scapularis]|nr:mpv17-like protein 2 [Ixodes scapularis]XP_029830729.2 mpv17-like protein 2 [Ixodes scapularis]